MAERLSGSCYCGKICFRVTPPLKMFSHCHCESCRRSHGAPFVSWTSVADEHFDLVSGTELLARYESSPGIVWQFCKNCGSSIFQTTKYSPGTTYIVAAAYNDPIPRGADGHMSFEEKVPWLEVNDDLPKFKEKTSDLLR